jgi:hypothetical protein
LILRKAQYFSEIRTKGCHDLNRTMLLASQETQLVSTRHDSCRARE